MAKKDDAPIRNISISWSDLPDSPHHTPMPALRIEVLGTVESGHLYVLREATNFPPEINFLAALVGQVMDWEMLEETILHRINHLNRLSFTYFTPKGSLA